MAYSFERDEPIPAAILRIMKEQIVRAREQLTNASASSEKRIHDARKRFKETRALLRMVREPLGAQFSLENRWFRDAGRVLTAIRDADVVFETLEKLDLPAPVSKRVKAALSEKRQHPPLDEVIARTLARLVVAEARLGLWPHFEDSFATIAGGLRRTYRDGRRSMKRADSDAALHEWRKRAKDLWYHIQLLRQIWPPVTESYEAVLDDLSHVLGDHHDLHMLAASIDPSPAGFVEAVREKKRRLERRAAELGAQIYTDRPNAWLARIENYWTAWRAR